MTMRRRSPSSRSGFSAQPRGFAHRFAADRGLCRVAALCSSSAKFHGYGLPLPSWQSLFSRIPA